MKKMKYATVNHIAGTKKMVVSMSDHERYERACPLCDAVTNRRSIDGGLTSQSHGECGHSWDVTPGAKMRRKDLERKRA